MYYSRPKEQSCANLRYENQRLEEQNEQYRRQEEERYQQRERDRRERQQAAREAECHAETWEEAFRKGLRRYRQEAAEEVSDNERYKSDPAWTLRTDFQEYVQKTEQAQAIYNEVMNEAERKIAEIKKQALAEAADRVQAECDYPELAGAMREDNCEFLTYW